ncbi:uncharacterized protein [Diadema setosum]|uniref:uncharacterized protein n=1 Tax=Diadema setosum TaxID=31175 RepID=UPI003B3B49E8
MSGVKILVVVALVIALAEPSLQCLPPRKSPPSEPEVVPTTQRQSVCANNLFFNECASACGPTQCGKTVEACIEVCDPKCDCPRGTMLCPEGVGPQDRCVEDCAECYEETDGRPTQ